MTASACPASNHEFKLHDWRWLAWPLSNVSAKGCWCRLCGLTRGKPDGQCATTGCLEYADAVDRKHCETCARRREINAARSTLAQKVLETVENMETEVGRLGCRKGSELNGWYRGQQNALAALRELFQREGIEVKL